MEFTQEQKIYAEIVQKAWEDIAVGKSPIKDFLIFICPTISV